MALRSEEIDPTIQALLTERLTQIFQQNAALDPLSARIKSAGMTVWKQKAKQSPFIWGAGGLAASALFAPPFLAQVSQGLAGPAMLSCLLLASLAFVMGVGRVQKELGQYASADVMRIAPELLALSPAENSYCLAVAALIDAGKVLDAQVQREVLEQLNGLLASYRRLDEPVKRARAASGTESVDSLECELAGLMTRRDAQTDSEARATMAQSVELCRRRLESARVIDPARQKAEAQQELILQTLTSVQSSLGRSSGLSVPLAAVNLGELQQSVTQVSTQTRAVEEAVAEVVAISA